MTALEYLSDSESSFRKYKEDSDESTSYMRVFSPPSAPSLLLFCDNDGNTNTDCSTKSLVVTEDVGSNGMSTSAAPGKALIRGKRNRFCCLSSGAEK